MKNLILSLFLITISNFTFCQNQGNIWFFGNNLGLDFNNGTPIALHAGNIEPNPQNFSEATIAEGSSCISDHEGNLLFYSNGEKIWNKHHEVMPNGDNILGMYSSTQSSFIIPLPLSDSIFYVFTTDGIERNLEDGLRYSIVDMCLDNGKGDVIDGQKNILLLDTVSEKLTAVNHENGKDIWLISHKFNSNAFYSYQISENGIIDTVITHIGAVHQGNGYYSGIGQMKASPDGNKIALVFSNVNPGVAELFDFNPATGILSNHMSLTSNTGEYGVEFSPDNSKLYITNSDGLHQFDLLAGDQSQDAINNSRTNIPMPTICTPSGLQLGPDGKIYVMRCQPYISIISNPNATGLACDFINQGILFDRSAGVSFPSFIANFDYNNRSPKCGLVGINSKLHTELNINIFPNPAHNYIVVNTNSSLTNKYSVVIYDCKGRTLKKLKNCIDQNLNIDLTNFNNGLIYVQVIHEGKIILGKKILVQNT